ncbi:MAG: NAD(P)/FAD-dependent oxidoreductase [Candidatus Hydrothermarchaeaceae archaeon]
MDYDSVVVGAGPAGSITAKTMAGEGLGVLLLEKRPEVGMPVRCGEAVGKRGLKEFGIHGDERFIANETRGVCLFAPDGTKVEMLNETPNGYLLERRYFDKYLAIQAAKAGAEVTVRAYAIGLVKEKGVVKGVHIKMFDEEYTVECGCVVGADGIESKVGRWAGIDTRVPIDQMTSNVQFEIAGVDVDQGALEFYFGSKVAPRGYAWVFPKGGDVANVGMGVRGSETTVYEHLKRFVASKDNLRGGGVIGVVAGGVPVVGPNQRSVAEGVVLVGDAARQVDPLTGGGIYNAMRCGVMAGRVIKEAVDSKDFSEGFLMKYEDLWRADVGKKLLKSQRVKEALERLSDDDLNKIARAMQGMNWGDVDIKDITKTIFRMPPELLNFIGSLMRK